MANRTNDPIVSKPALTITRTDVDVYAVKTDVMLSDGTLRADNDMQFDGVELRSRERRGHIRIGGLMIVKLGPVSLAKVRALNVGDSTEVR